MNDINSKKKVIFSLVYNEGTNDSRVMKEAKALVKSGFEVYLICKKIKGLDDRGIVEGVNIFRFPCWEVKNENSFFLKDLESFEKTFPILQKHASSQMRYISNLRSLVGLREKAPIAFLLPKVFFSVLIKLHQLYARAKGFLWKSLSGVSRRTGGKLDWFFNIFLNILKYNHVNDMYYARYALYAMNVLREEIGVKPDFIHAHDLYTVPAGILLAKKHNAKIVYDAHELEVERVPPLPPVRKEFIKNLEKDSFKSVDAIITVSKFLQTYYQNNYPEGEVSLVMNIPETFEERTEPKEEVDDIRTQLSIDKDSKIIVYTGGVSRQYRGLHIVVEALSMLGSEFHLAIMGPRVEGNDQWLKAFIDKFCVADRVHFLPSVPPNEVVKAIESGTIAICPIQDASLSYRYSLPNKLFEAIHAKLPLCVSDLPEMSEVVQELSVGRSMDQTSAKSISECILEVTKNRDDYLGGENFDELLEAKYSWSSQVKTLLSVYSKLLNKNEKRVSAGG